ncbi:MAG: hypothetical protein C5B51_16090 [Terriglobia bacterium]|nr:MAG: hypothetical protein C5B51_16090 [Terriglobia bacterium]
MSGNGVSGTADNFGIGLVTASDTGNVVEDNTVTGNLNGIVVVAGVQGNIFRGNLVTGNPPLQVSINNSAARGFDIKNLAEPGANAFEGNICQSSTNAPCPSTGPSLTANPNPIPVVGSPFLGATTLSWNAPDAQLIEIHIGSPDGKLFTQNGNRGSMQTGAWIPDGMTFYLQDVTGGKPLTSDYTLATLVVRLQTSSHATLRNDPLLWAGGFTLPVLGFIACGIHWRRRSSTGRG